MSAARYICIHGHFYQPPRENPWLEEVEIQNSAHPFHDWNERITYECYAPNSASRLLNGKDEIIDIVNNYAGISFNFGPTLLSWLQTHRGDIYEAILEADRLSRDHFGGHGAALAQCYSHMIMPLANRQDKLTQILWGIRDFQYRFERDPEGMWLPETAVDLETLDLLAEQNIRFTILAPRQARRIRRVGEEAWQDVSEEKVNSRQPYLCRLPSGREIALFFYDGKISQDVAFKGLLHSGDAFARRLLGGFEKTDEPQLVHIATDGETFGHHHRYGEMALAYCLNKIHEDKSVAVTIYAEYLEKHPPIWEVEIIENSSWSCAHGIERWRSDCGCNSGIHAGWKQTWRAPLREALDELRDRLAEQFEQKASTWLADPTQARNAYIDLILDRSADRTQSFLEKFATDHLTDTDKTAVLKLLEMQRHALLMYTSCGWFFDDISGIETIQIIAYAVRAMQLAEEVCGPGLSGLLEPFVKRLEQAPSNNPLYTNGADVYEKCVNPSVLDLYRVAAHYAIDSLFKPAPEAVELYTYQATNRGYADNELGQQKLAQGTVGIQSRLTGESAEMYFAALYFGDTNLIAGVRPADNDPDGAKRQNEQKAVRDLFEKNYILETIRLIESQYSNHAYSLHHLFRDEQRSMMNQLLQARLDEIQADFTRLFDQHFPMMQVIRQMNIPQPRVLEAILKVIFSNDLQNALEASEPQLEDIKTLVDQIVEWDFTPDRVTLAFAASRLAERLMHQCSEAPENPQRLETIVTLLQILDPLELPLDLWESQNICFVLNRKYYVAMQQRTDEGDETAGQWLKAFTQLGSHLNVRIGR